MIRIEIEPVWRFRRDDDPESHLLLVSLLNEIRLTGKISRAAEREGLSYRHAWNLIEKWSGFFEVPLVERKRGSGTSLTAFGAKLVWAGQRLDARLGPQLQNLSQELETEINQLLPRRPTIIRVHASHGFAVSKLRELLLRERDLGVDIRYVSNQNSLVSLAHDGCDLAGMHLPQGELRKRSIAACKGWLTPSIHRVIGFVTREMGLMVKKGNPFGIASLSDLLHPAVRFVNRDPDSGTRLLFDQLLAQQGVDGAAINGFEHVEFTHAAVAAYVASGMADVSFGVEAAARQFDLDFVRLLTEDYLFVCNKNMLETESMKRVLDIMQSEEFQTAILQLPGYECRDAGLVKTVAQAFQRSEYGSLLQAARHILYICKAENCDAAGSQELIEHLEQRLGIRIGNTTPDGALAFRPIYCLGNCNHAPAILLDDKPYGPVTSELADRLIDAIERGNGEVQ